MTPKPTEQIQAPTRPKRKRRPPEVIAAEKAEREERKRRREEANAAERRKREGQAEVIRRRAALAKSNPARERLAEEERGLAQRRRLQRAGARETRRLLLEGGIAADAAAAIPEQSLVNVLVLRQRRAEPTRLARLGPVHDPRFKIDARLYNAAQHLENLAQAAQRIGPSRNPLAAWIEDGGIRAQGEGDPDASRARILGAQRQLERVLAALPAAPELQTPAGPRSERDAIRLCVLEGLPIAALAAVDSGRRWGRARNLLVQALESLAQQLELRHAA